MTTFEYNKPKSIGGVINSKGFKFQDCTAISFLFDNILKEGFRYLTLEQIEDFSLIFNKYELCFQVKNELFTMSKVKSIISSLSKVKGKKYCFICSSMNQEFKNYLNRIEEYREAEKIGRSKKELKNIHKELDVKCKNKLSISLVEFLSYEFYEISSQIQEEYSIYHIYQYLDSMGISNVDTRKVFEDIYSCIGLNRPKRGSINKIIVDDIIERCRNIPNKNKRVISNEITGISSLIDYIEGKKETYPTIRTHLKLISQSIKLEDYNDAINLLTEISNIDKVFKMCIFYLCVYSQEFLTAKDLINKYIDEYGINYHSFYCLGLIYFKSKKYNKALRFFSKAKVIKKEDINFDHAFYLGMCHKLLKKDIKKSIEYFDYCLAINENRADIHFEVAQLKTFSGALSHLDAAIKLEPEYSEAIFLKAEMLRIIGEVDKAYRYFIRYFSISNRNRNNFRALLNMYFCTVELNKVAESFQYLLPFIDSYFIKQNLSMLKEGEKIGLIDLTWRGVDLISCTKKGSVFFIETPICQFNVPISTKEIQEPMIALGVKLDSFLLSSEVFFSENTDRDFDIERTLKPYFLKVYYDDLEYLKRRNNLYEVLNDKLNKEYEEVFQKVPFDTLYDYFPNLNSGDTLRYKEYILKSAKVKITDYSAYILVTIDLHTIRIESDFRGGGKGYFAMRKFLEKSSETSILLYSVNLKELIEISIPSKNVSIEMVV